MLANFELFSNFKPKGSQPIAIKELVDGINSGKRIQTLLGVTGSGKTFTIANVIAKVKKPTLVIAHNKTLAAQLFEEFKEFFPKNRVEYFISYYDYYQPESYIPSKDQYIEKDASVNPKIEMMRQSATSSIMSRKDVIIVASVSCIYGLGNPKSYSDMVFQVSVNEKISRKDFILKLMDSLYERNDLELSFGRFRVKGDVVDFVPSYKENIIRVEFYGDSVDSILEVDKNTGEVLSNLSYFYVYPAKHYIIPKSYFDLAIEDIKKQLEDDLKKINDPLIANRLRQRTNFDIEVIKETGTCKGIENYSRHFEFRKPGEKPFCLLDYFGDDFLIVIDESHRTIPQISGMYHGDYTRKKNLVDYGFRLSSAFDNRPLKFEEFEEYLNKNNVIFVSATPGDYEYKKSQKIVEQIIRPTGLVDPVVEVRPAKTQIEDVKKEIENTIKRGDRILLTTLTKKMAEDLTEYLSSQNIKTRYLHSEIDSLERTEIIRELRLGKFDCLVGINLLREGLDIPEVGFVGVLDADKEGFLRDSRSLIQVIGRAARNVNSKVVLYADVLTESIKSAISETERRRKIQMEYNKKNKIIPKTIKKPIKDKVVEIKDIKHIPKNDIPNLIIELESEMRQAAELLDFERAIEIRNRIYELKKRI